MMTLEEAILYCEEVAEINQSIADNTDHNNWMDIAKCEKCADEYHQVAEWLRELKQYREQPEIVRCKDCKHKPSGNATIIFPDDKCPCKCEDYWYSWIPRDDWYCGNAERKEVTK